MKQTIGVKVPFTRQNAKKCICWECPVQANSQCVKDNSKKMGDVLTAQYFEPQLFPGLYCSSGVASCNDIDTNQDCICGGCQVYNEYNLDRGAPIDYYCKNGNAR